MQPGRRPSRLAQRRNAPLSKHLRVTVMDWRSLLSHRHASTAKQSRILRRKTLDCFAALAMTEQDASSPLSNFRLSLQTHLRIPAADFARALLRLSTLSIQEGAGKAGCRLAPTVRCAKAHAEELHSGIQVKPNTRPSLRSGLTAYAVLSREPNSFWPPSPPRKSRTPRRLTRMPPPRKLDRSNDGQDHTVLPYARLTCSPHYLPALSTLPEECWRDEPDSAARLARSLGLTESNPPCP